MNKTYFVSIVRMLGKKNEEYMRFSEYVTKGDSAYMVRSFPAGELWRVSYSEEDLVFIRMRYGERAIKRLRER